MAFEERKKKILLYFAEQFSSQKGEEFIEQELNYFAPYFKEIHVFTFRNNIEECKYPLAKNIKVIDFNLYAAYSRIALFKNKLFFLLKMYFTQILRSNNKSAYIKRLKFYFNSLLNNTDAALRLNKYIAQNYKSGEYCIESFWFNRWVFVLSLAKDLQPTLIHTINTRTHGGDYDETQTKTFFPFRSLQMKYVNTISPVSKYGEHYIKNKY